MTAKKKARASGKARAPGAGRPKGARSAIATLMCASIAEYLIRSTGAKQKNAILAAMSALQRQPIAESQRAEFALLNDNSIRTAFKRLQKSGKWVMCGPGLLLEAASELHRMSVAAQIAKAELAIEKAKIVAGLALHTAYEAFLKTNPSDEERLKWLAEQNAIANKNAGR